MEPKDVAIPVPPRPHEEVDEVADEAEVGVVEDEGAAHSHSVEHMMSLSVASLLIGMLQGVSEEYMSM